jgi:hypothetical protein
MAVRLNQVATPPRPSIQKAVSAIQIGLALLQAVLVMTTPFAWFKFYGYGAFGIGFDDSASTGLLMVVIAITAVALVAFAYLWGWSGSAAAAAKYARLTMIAGVSEWIWVVSVVLDVWNRITYHSTFAFEGYNWWLGTASYAVVIGAIAFTALGFAAVQLTRPVAPPRGA